MMKKILERLFDVTLAISLLTVLAVPMLLTALAVYIVLGRPLFFTQQRPGLHGCIFTIYKFRTMTNKTDANNDLLSDEVRLGRFGQFIRKFSLDELPQLLNILKGDMRFVGPRPLIVEYLPLYTEEQRRRHDVKPGVTGWAQVNGRNAISFGERFQMDVWYVDNRSFLLDLKIMGLTALRLIKPQGVNQPGCATAKPFNGKN
jgi:sugar transferase EpsL